MHIIPLAKSCKYATVSYECARTNAPEARAAKFSIPSIIALVAAALSFMTGAVAGFVLAIIAICFGLLGVVLSFSSRTRGGVVSTLSLLAGFIGIVAAVIKALAWIL